MPAELDGSPLRERVRRARSIARSRPTRAGFRRWRRTSARSTRSRPRTPTASIKSVIRAKALDTLRGLLPAATHVERRPVRHRPGVRGAAAAHVRAPARGGPRLRASRCSTELRQVIPAFLTRVDQPNRGGRWIEYFAETRRALRRGGRAVRRRRRRRTARRGHADRFRSGRRDQGRRRRALRRVGAARRSAAGASRARMSADDRAALLRAYVGDRAQPPPQAGPRVRAHQLPLRRAHRLRRVPRSAAPSPADARLAAAQHAPRLHRAGRHRGGRRARRLARGDGRSRRICTSSCRAPACATPRRTPS